MTNPTPPTPLTPPDPQLERLIDLVCLRAAEGLDPSDTQELERLLLLYPSFEPRCYEECLAIICFERGKPHLEAPPEDLVTRLRAAAKTERQAPRRV